MAYKKDQGRYVRMAAFWALLALVGYGCFGGFVNVLDGWTGRPWLAQFPLLGKFGMSELIACGVFGAAIWFIYRQLNRPKVADLLIDTEGELRQVVWPTGAETMRGTVAVAVTVIVLLLFLLGTDLLLTWSIKGLLGVGG